MDFFKQAKTVNGRNESVMRSPNRFSFRSFQSLFRRSSFVSLLSGQKTIGGLLIREELAELALLEIGKMEGGGNIHPVFYRRVPLPAGTISEGKLIRPGAFTSSLGMLKDEAEKIGLRSVVVSLPSDIGHFFSLEYPMHLTRIQVDAALDLAAESLFPLPPADLYHDRVILSSRGRQKQEVMVGIASRACIEPYLSAIEAGGFSPVAVETHSMSVARFFTPGAEGRTVVFLEPTGVAVVVYDSDRALIHHYIPRRILEDKNGISTEQTLVDHIARCVHAAKAGPSRIEAGNIVIIPDRADHWGLTPHLKKRNLIVKEIDTTFAIPGEHVPRDGWMFAALGAAQRGLIPRKLDTFISFMAVGTELAYERARVISLADFLQKFCIIIGAFVVLLLMALLVFVHSVEERARVAENSVFIPPRYGEMRESAHVFNQTVGAIYALETSSPKWIRVIEEVEKLQHTGVSFREIDANPSGAIRVEGVAVNRDGLLVLKHMLDDSLVFTADPLPLPLLLEKENISFRLNLRLKNPEEFFP